MSASQNEARHIVITGVSQGLGRALVHGMVAAGHRVSGCARNQEAIDELRNGYSAPHHFATLDVSQAGDVESWAQRVIETQGPPDLLLNNAATINRNACLWEVPCEEFSNVVDINIKGVYHVARAFLPAMIEQQQGVLVNFSSGWGRSTSPEVAPYCATKWAIEGMTQALADELPAGLAAIPLNPGVIHTKMLDSCFGEHAAAYPSAEQWASTAVPFLLNLSSKDNGQPLTAPG